MWRRARTLSVTISNASSIALFAGFSNRFTSCSSVWMCSATDSLCSQKVCSASFTPSHTRRSPAACTFTLTSILLTDDSASATTAATST